MACVLYTQHTADGDRHAAQRAVRQGRKPMPVELVKVKVEAMVLPATRARAIDEARKYNMSLSAYIDLAVSLFDVSSFSS